MAAKPPTTASMMESLIVQQVIGGIIGGAVTGITALAVIKVEIKYLRRDVDHAHARIDNCNKGSKQHA